MRGDSYQLQGQQGGQVINSASGLVTKKFRNLVFVTDTVLTGLAGNLVGLAGLIGPTIPARTELGGQWEGIQVASGVVVAYYA